MTHKFYPEEIERLSKEYREMRQVRFDGNGSAAGNHYLLVKTLKEMGVHRPFEASSDVERYIEHVLLNKEAPTW